MITILKENNLYHLCTVSKIIVNNKPFTEPYNNKIMNMYYKYGFIEDLNGMEVDVEYNLTINDFIIDKTKFGIYFKLDWDGDFNSYINSKQMNLI